MKATLSKFKSLFKSKKQHCQVLHQFDISKYKYRKKYRLQLAKKLISNPNTNTFLASISKYDLFATLAVKTNENQISDAIASCLNPKKSIWGKEILLKLIEKNTGNSQLYNIIKNTPSKRFYVKREWSGEFSRIDIRIITKNQIPEQNVIIDFEMKVGSGEETLSNGIFQTQREWKDLTKLAKSQNIPNENVIAFYVSPLGITPHSKNFISIRYSYFNGLIKETLLNSKDTSNLEYKYAFIHFISSKYIFQE